MYKKIKVIIPFVILLSVLAIFILSIFRIVDVYSLSNDAFSNLSDKSKFEFWFMGLRFDAKLVAIVMAPLVFIGLISDNNLRFFSFIAKIFGAIFLTILTTAGLSNFQYIKTYGHHFDLMVFGLVNEEPLAVLKSIWDGYPVILIILISSIVFVCSYYLLKKICNFLTNKTNSSKSIIAVLSLLVFIPVLVFLIRGDLGKFPLRRASVAVTDLPSINEHVPSGLLSFAWTVSDYFNEEELDPANVKDIEDCAKFFHLNLSNDYKDIISKISSGPSNHPHVVFAVMESMSFDMLSVDNEQTFNVLGSLRSVIDYPQVHYFQNFLSEGDGTIDSLSRILVRSGNYFNHSVGRFQHNQFFTSAAFPYKEAGYRTILVTAGNRGWRNLGNFAQANGFDEIIDDIVIRSHKASIKEGVWGVFDGDMFNEAYDVLKNSDQPIFMVILSVTNHPPYALPKDYVPSNMIRPNKVVEDKYHNNDIYSMYETYRYANDMLGNFFIKIMNEEKLKNNTIIAATGDHNVRGLNVYQSTDKQVLGHQVPFIIRRLDSKTTDIAKYASHKDIMPTLFEASLNKVPYYYPGCDLFSEKQCAFSFAYNEQVSVSKDGVCISDNKKQVAYAEKDFVAREKINSEAKICKLATEYSKLTEWYYLYQTIGLMTKTDTQEK